MRVPPIVQRRRRQADYRCGVLIPIELALRQLRERNGMTQSELAAVVGVRQATISDIARGESRRLDRRRGRATDRARDLRGAPSRCSRTSSTG